MSKGHYSDRLKRNLEASIKRKQLLLKQVTQLRAFDAAVALVVSTYRMGGRLYIAGNGGSAADSQHLAAEFVSKLARPRNPIPAEALTTDTSILTAIGNDYGFEHIFSRQIQAKMICDDLFLGITTSGNSPNIINALKEAKAQGALAIAFTGPGGGLAKKYADFCVCVPGKTPSDVQELHIVLLHTLCACVEDALI